MSCEEYRVFLEEFHTDEELLTIKVGPYRLTESEILGEVINWTLQYLSENKCPTKLSAPITRNVVETIQNECRKSPQLCGYDENEKTFDPSKLKNIVILALKTFCQRLLDNVELNKILPDLRGNDYTPLCISGAIRNKRRAMEDRHICIEDFNETYNIQNATKARFYAVFDGHDGYHAAYYSVSQLPYLLASSPLYPLNPAEAMRQSFRGTDIAFVQKTYQQSIRGGTTAVCALYLPDESRLYVGWVGDSKALLVKQGKIMQIVKPHKPEDPKEKKRIHAAGGTVINWDGLWRVDGILNLSRAIGDSKCKPYVTGDPDIVGLELDKNEDFLVLACDGLWDHVAEDKVAEIIYQQLNEDTENLNKIPQKLIERSKQEGSTDNITIVIVFLKDPYQIVKNTCKIEIMEPAFDNCNIGEFNNSEQVLSTNANSTTQITADQSKEYFDDNQHQDEHLNSNQLIQQFNDGLNNFLQDPKNVVCTNNLMSNINQIELKNQFDQMNVDEKFLNDLDSLNEQLIDDMNKVETPTDYEHEACIDVTDDIAMVTTENSDNSTVSHSKDTLPLSDNFNPFDNKLSLENRSEYNPDNIDYLHNDNENDDTKSTPMISPDTEEIMNQGSDDIISPEYEQPILEELASGVELLTQQAGGNSESAEILHQQQENFDNNDFMQTNGHLSPEKQIVYDDQGIYNDHHQQQQQHIPEINSDILNDHKNEEINQYDYNVNRNVEDEHQNVFGLNSIKENQFESNYVEGFSHFDYNPQSNLLASEENRNDINDGINILNGNEIIDANLSSVNELNPNLMRDDEQQLQYEKEHEIVQEKEEHKENVCEERIEMKTDFTMVGTSEQNLDTNDKVQNNENSSIPTDNFTEQNMESIEKQPENKIDVKHQAQNFEDDGFAEQEFAEHDNFDEQNFDQPAVPQNPPVGSEIGNKPISQQQDSNVLDESEDEWQYMRLKEKEETIETAKVLDNREEILDLKDTSIDDSTQQLPTEISLEERRDLSKEEQKILSSSPKTIANNLNKTPPIATDLDDDMNYQLNPEAKEFIPLSPPTATNVFLQGDNNNGLIMNGDGLIKISQQQHLVGDDVVAQSPRKGNNINMDEIYVPEQTEFDIEVRHRPHELIGSAQKLAAATVAALEEINDGNGDQPELYQELNLKEAMHGSEKEEQILSPTNDVDGDLTGIINNPIYNPVAEFENIDMKDSIYIEKSSSNQEHENQQQNNNNKFDTNEDILNSVQLIPDHFDSNKSSSTEFILKEDMVSNENDIASPTNEIAITNSSITVNGLSSQENNDEKIQNITNDLNILKLSSDDTSINESSNDTIEIDTNNTALAAVAIAATTIVAAGVTAAAAMSPATNDKNTKQTLKVAEKNIKNKLNAVKSPKVPEKKLSATTTTALTKTATSTQPKKVPSSTSKTSVTSNNKPKTITVATPPAPKTLTFPRPRTAPATTGTKCGTNSAAGTTTTTTTTTKTRVDTNRPATLTVKKPLTTKTTSTTIESKTNTIKSNVSKTGVSAKSSATSRTSATTSVVSKPRPASATTANGSSGTVTTTKSQTRPASVKSISKPPLSPRGTFTSTLRKTEAIKSPTKSTTTSVSTTTKTGPLKGSTTTTTRTTSAPKTSSGTVRKTITKTTHTSSLAPGKTSSTTTTTTVPKKITPIKRPPTLVKKELTPEKDSNVNGNSSVNDTVEQQVNGVAPVSVDLTNA